MAVNPFILTPKDEPKIELMGGKAYALAKLGKAFPIPNWVVLTPHAFTSKALKKAAKEALIPHIKALGEGPFAVRSSAIDEDGSDSSFAGQLESYLNVEPPELEKYICKVLASAYSKSVKEYRKQRGLTETPSAPGILIQNMSQADSAGVAFSADPVHNDPNKIVIMATHGLADKLVSGEVNGDSYYLTRDGKIKSQDLIDDKAIMSAEHLKSIADLCLKAEKHFGCPQDVEWTLENNKIYLVQSRPITTLAPTGKRVIWDNSNIVESYSGVTSPLTFSFARYAYAEVYRALAKVMGVSSKRIEAHKTVFENMLGFINGHVYYNLLNWYKGLSILPGFTMNRKFMEQMMGVKEALPEDLVQGMIEQNPGTINKALDTAHFVSTLLRILINGFTLPFQVKRFYKHLNAVLEEPDKPLDQMDITELAEHYRYLEQQLLSQWYPPLVNDLMCMIAFGASQRVLKKWCGEDEGQALHNDFMIGQGDIISAEPAQRIRDMAALVRGHKKIVDLLISGNQKAIELHEKFAEAFQSYLDKFGDRCTQELKLESFTLHEDPTTLLQAIGFTAQREDKGHEEKTHDPSETLHEALNDKPFKKFIAQRLINWAKGRVRDRENLRFERTRVFGRVRRVFLEIGKHLVDDGFINHRRDVFFLQVEELLGLIEGTLVTYDLKSIVDLRKKQAEEFETMPSMPNRFETNGAVFTDFYGRELKETIVLADGDTREGLGCCTGVVRAKVRVVTDPRKEALEPGEILVAKHTDPGWIALFSNASGILVERGSLLSHSAIVAREMGIPAIVAIGDVMQWLKTGDVVEMDGASGKVVKVEE